MYNINKRAEFKTVGDLKRLLVEVPDEAKLYICGACGWFHINEESNVICLDTDDLEEYYDYDDDEDECPLGGDITNDCADCVYSIDYHYENGKCVRRKEYIPSAENGDYSPSNPWDAPGMSTTDFI